MNVIIACEFSGRVREAFKAKGHSVVSFDLLPTEIPGWHVQDDVRKYLRGKWDLLIAFPPCTYLCNSGVRWLHTDDTRPAKMKRAAKFFKDLLTCDIPKIAIENPIMHKYALDIIGTNYKQIIQPWQFGHGETKATCLWLKGLPKLKPTKKVKGREGRVHREPPSKDRWKNRSRTYEGIAKAMAEQWG
jgi:hypothetical protein